MIEDKDKKDPIMDAYKAWLAKPSQDSSRALLSSLDTQIGTALHTFAPGMEDHLRLKARTMALQAAGTYDPGRGMHLKSYVYQQLQPIQREFGKRSNAVRLPERHLLDRKRLDHAEAEFEAEKGRPPSVAELADYTSIPVDAIARARAHKPQMAESQTVDKETGDAYRGVASDPQEMWAHHVYNSLGPVDQRIYEMVTGFGGARTYPKGEIARRLRISAPAVSQRINRIAARLEEGMNLG